jgi:hypothetical protein
LEQQKLKIRISFNDEKMAETHFIIACSFKGTHLSQHGLLKQNVKKENKMFQNENYFFTGYKQPFFMRPSWNR